MGSKSTDFDENVATLPLVILSLLLTSWLANKIWATIILIAGLVEASMNLASKKTGEFKQNGLAG